MLLSFKVYALLDILQADIQYHLIQTATNLPLSDQSIAKNFKENNLYDDI